MAMLSRAQALSGFVAGALAVVVFHQGIAWLISRAGIANIPAWSWAPTQPWGVPLVLSLAFWGGLWGILWVLLASRLKGGGSLGFAFLFGAILPTLVYAAVVLPLKGGDPKIFLDPKILIGALVLNGAWGAGTEFFVRLGRSRIW